MSIRNIVFAICLCSSRVWGGSFEIDVWTKVAAKSCLECHKAGGDAEDSRFVMIDPSVNPDPGWIGENHRILTKVAKMSKQGKPLILLKASEEIEHEGGEALEKNSTGYRILRSFVNGEIPLLPDSPEPPFFEGITLLEDWKLLRRLTLSLAARLPTKEEKIRVEAEGLDAIPTLLDRIMEGDAFYERLLEGFNDIFLMRGYEGVPERALGYRNFGETRQWFNQVKFEHIEDEKERTKAKYAFTARYRESILEEPYAFIEYIVRNNRPFTEIVTADYLMVSPMTAKSYDIYDQVKDQFENPDDHMEFVPAKLPELTYRDGKPDQKTPSGLYPHAGLLTTFHYLKRYPNTETNRNRLRSRMYFRHFLGIDVMELAPRVSDAAKIDAEYEVPTMEAGECVICHKSVDPIAGIFQDYHEVKSDNAPYGPRKEGWYTDMFKPGVEGRPLSAEESWRGPQWLGEITAQDPRFATAMVGHVYYIMFGRNLPLPPGDIDDPLFDAKQRAYLEIRREVDRIARRFKEEQFNLKNVFRDWAISPFYRVDQVAINDLSPQRAAELDDLGVVRLLSPEQLTRKIKALFENEWNLLSGQQYLRILYGGIDSKEVTERLTDPGGAMGAIQRMMAHKVACDVVPTDFALPPSKRVLFPGIDVDTLPADEKAIRSAIIHLHQYILGRRDLIDDEEVTRTYQLFSGIIGDATAEERRIDPRENYFCQAGGQRVPDPHYTLRAWRAVVTYLLRQPEFLYE